YPFLAVQDWLFTGGVTNGYDVYPKSHRGQASMRTSNAHVRFGLDRMEEYYVSFKEKPQDLLKLSQRAQIHESQLVNLAKSIPSGIQLSIKKVMQPARDKLKGLCTTIEVLETEVNNLRKEVAALRGPPSTRNPIPPEPTVVPSQPEAPKSPTDD
ncbi:hypothetical protein HAX54_047900, partial [Datura stramonium]|nr:hypothetical protein [Datura stramonium]